MANAELNALTAATAATGGIYYGEQSGASRKFTITAVGATLAEAADVAAQRTALGLATSDSPQFTALNIGHASDTTLTRVSAGVIAVEGATILVSGGALGTPSGGTLTSCTGLPVSTGISGLGTGVATALAAGASTGGNGATDSGKVVTFNSTGGASFGKSDAAATLTVTSTTNALQVNSYGAGNAMDVATHVAATAGYSFHCGGTSNTGVALDFSLSPNGGTGFYCDFGAGHSGCVGLDLGMAGLGIAIRSDAWSVTAVGAATWTPAANTTAITISSATHTSSAPVLDAAQTWNAVGTTFTAIKLNVTNTASAAGSKLIDLQVGGTSQFYVNSGGTAILANGIYCGRSTYIDYFAAASIYVTSDSAVVALGANSDLLMYRAAAASLQLGTNHATTPTAQTIKAHDVTTGTGAALTLAGGKGSTAGGVVNLATSATNGAPVTHLEIGADGVLNLASVSATNESVTSDYTVPIKVGGGTFKICLKS